MPNKSVMFARKKTRAGTCLRVAPARPIHWRYVLVIGPSFVDQLKG